MTDRSPPLLESMNGLVLIRTCDRAAVGDVLAIEARSNREWRIGTIAATPDDRLDFRHAGFQLVAGLPDDGDGWKEASKEPEPELRVGDVVVYEHARAIHVALFGVAHVLVPLARLAARVVRRMREGVR